MYIKLINTIYNILYYLSYLNILSIPLIFGCDFIRIMSKKAKKHVSLSKKEVEEYDKQALSNDKTPTASPKNKSRAVVKVDAEEQKRLDRQAKYKRNLLVEVTAEHRTLADRINSRQNYVNQDLTLILKQINLCKSRFKKYQEELDKLIIELLTLNNLAESKVTTNLDGIEADATDESDVHDMLVVINDSLSLPKNLVQKKIKTTTARINDITQQVRVTHKEYSEMLKLRDKVRNTLPDKGRYAMDQMNSRDSGAHQDIPLDLNGNSAFDWGEFNRNFMNNAIHTYDDIEPTDNNRSIDYDASRFAKKSSATGSISYCD